MRPAVRIVPDSSSSGIEGYVEGAQGSPRTAGALGIEEVGRGRVQRRGIDRLPRGDGAGKTITPMVAKARAR
jgi:hypothetical protein